MDQDALAMADERERGYKIILLTFMLMDCQENNGLEFLQATRSIQAIRQTLELHHGSNLFYSSISTFSSDNPVFNARPSP
jgi:hypothetical protein